MRTPVRWRKKNWQSSPRNMLLLAIPWPRSNRRAQDRRTFRGMLRRYPRTRPEAGREITGRSIIVTKCKRWRRADGSARCPPRIRALTPPRVMSSPSPLACRYALDPSVRLAWRLERKRRWDPDRYLSAESGRVSDHSCDRANDFRRRCGNRGEERCLGHPRRHLADDSGERHQERVGVDRKRQNFNRR